MTLYLLRIYREDVTNPEKVAHIKNNHVNPDSDTRTFSALSEAYDIDAINEVNEPNPKVLFIRTDTVMGHRSPRWIFA